ncbi:hypothetical protein ACFLYB_05275 [Chloroflexota bacterium]
MVNAIFVIIGLAFLTLIGWAAKDFFTATDTSVFIRILVGIIIVGGVALLGIAIRDRMKQAKKEDFKEVEK